jgi:hypothetical protein
MSKPSYALTIAALASVSFWLGSLPGIGLVAYNASLVGVGYEGGVGGFVAGTILMGFFWAVPAAAFFIVVLLTVMLFGKTAGRHDWQLYVLSGLFGLLCSWFLARAG